jgi:DNA polymerase-1
MARVIASDTMTDIRTGEPAWTDKDTQLWLYNAMDNCITHEVYEALPTQLGGFAYGMSRCMQAPALTLMRRGVRINGPERERLVEAMTKDLATYERMFSRLTGEAFGQAINPRSPAQLQKLFYEFLRFKPITKYDKKTKERKVTTDRAALEKISLEPRGYAFTKFVLGMRDVAKRLNVLNSGISPDGRLRCTYSVAGTETGRWSSSESAFYEGTNLQNVTDAMRRIVIPDPGKKFMQFDLAQAESVIVGYLSGDEAYKSAIRSGDLHTYVCRLVWPELPWTGDNKLDREIAEQKYYRDYSYRDLAKRGGHGSNYGGTPAVLSMHLKISIEVAERFQAAYFKAFPGIRLWHARIQMQIATKKFVETPFGRRCYYPGRPSDTTLLKSAIAYGPQSTIGDALNYGFYKVFTALDYLGTGEIELLLQVHDSILFQYTCHSHEYEQDLLSRVAELLLTPVKIGDDWALIKSDAQTGWNWGKQKKTKTGEFINEWGLADFRGQDDRQAPEELRQLDQRVYPVHKFLKFSRDLSQVGGADDFGFGDAEEDVATNSG